MKKLLFIYRSVYIQAFCLLQTACLFMNADLFAANPADTLGMYVAPNAVFYANTNTGISLFSNVINEGVFGSAKGVTINMFGDRWRNTNTASFPDEWGINNPNAFTGVGGAFRFANNFPQYIDGGYSATAKSGGAFPNLIVENPTGLYLENTDTHITGTLAFKNGLLWLNGSNLVIGGNNPGSIIGYTENRFVATGNNPQGGYLFRSKISSATGSVVFPIGTQAGSYAPVSVMFNTTKAQDLHARVFDNIYTNAVIGRTGSPASVQQTWNLGQEDTSNVPSIIALQHMQIHEGPSFTAHRGNSYVSRYDFSLKTWDTLGPSGFSYPGTYTTGTPQQGAYINPRFVTGLGQNTYLTKNADKKTDSITLAKAVLSPVREADGSFRVSYLFLVSNAGITKTDSVHVIDSLDKVFTAPSRFSITSLSASGNLVVNTGFNGTTDYDLLKNTSTLTGHKTDTITLVLNVVTNKKDGYYYNTAYLGGVLNSANGQYVFSTPSVNGISTPSPASPAVPTPVILSASKYTMPEGFSPNGDGINDKLVIGNLGNDNAAIWIFNKQGTIVYKNMNYKNDWDGSYYQNLGGQSSLQKVEDGTYFYKVVVTEASTGKQETYYGYISIWK